MGESQIYSGLKVSRALLEEIERQNKTDEYRTQRGLLPLTAKASEPNFYELQEYILKRPWERQIIAQPDEQQQNPVKRGRGRPRKEDKQPNANDTAGEPRQKKAKESSVPPLSSPVLDSS